MQNKHEVSPPKSRFTLTLCGALLSYVTIVRPAALPHEAEFSYITKVYAQTQLGKTIIFYNQVIHVKENKLLITFNLSNHFCDAEVKFENLKIQTASLV